MRHNGPNYGRLGGGTGASAGSGGDAALLYFGGVAFKYQRPVDDLAEATTKASRFIDVVTTSGAGTGHAASPGRSG